ncbi:hypothetical protein F4813DRAFT_396358 [Daldinia decipiens]|uniref:uncharacterized protein n=1 Tax=Daldinia decipiens TaxID=326647 RepID=UPI0020C5413A|nr:uncharacterized protein F4813DRAFT_396358 [Daldinia decipiens]KAI1657463.1 hypothetical protein F4813DRAFT_396358 [Daldinia decipiens]
MASHTKEAKKDDGPPPYSEHGTDGAASLPLTATATATAEAPPPPPCTQQPPLPRQFPPAFNMYIESRHRYHIGVHQSTPLYAVTLSRASFSHPEVVLHSGPGHQTPALAVVARPSRSGDLTVTLAAAAAEERVETPAFLGGGETFSFGVEVGVGVGDGGGEREREREREREMFEWRRSRGDAVAALGGRASGWKLVRMRRDAASGLGGGGRGRGRGQGQAGVFGRGAAAAGDGREVVAVWAWANMSLTKKLRFRFLGTGASGVLGERWAVMAVATALWAFDKERRAREE